jgi:pyruvate oxidase
LKEALTLISQASRPVIIVGNGARKHRDAVLRLAEKIDAPIISTFKAKGMISDSHPLRCSTLGRSGTPVASYLMGKSDLLIVLGASFSVHTGISPRKKTIQVDFDRMILGKFHPVTCPLWGEIGVTSSWLVENVEAVDRPSVREDLADRWAFWRQEKKRREPIRDEQGRLHPALVFRHLSEMVSDDAVLCVDVGNNTYSFGRFFESRGCQDVLMSGYLGSIGFAFPAALGAWAAVGNERKVVSISGDGGFGQYLAEFTTAVKYNMDICHILLNNGQLGKISKEQRAGGWEVWSTDLVNPDFAAYARLCGGEGYRVTEPEQLSEAISAALKSKKPALVEILTDPRQT